MKHTSLWAFILAAILLLTTATTAFSFDWSSLWKPKTDREKIAAGLKEALRVGTENSVKQTGRVDGFFKNPSIKVPLPDELKKMEKLLRRFGMGEQVDQFVLSLNRAAEQAAPAAKEIFWSAIKEMTFDDAVTIFNGNDTAATDYFKEKTSAKLKAAFMPAVSKATDEADVTKIYKKLTLEITKVKILNMKPVNIDDYVVTKTLNGIFHVLGEEEAKIRQDPAARITELLKEVFGK